MQKVMKNSYMGLARFTMVLAVTHVREGKGSDNHCSPSGLVVMLTL